MEIAPVDVHDDAAVDAWHATYLASDVAGRPWATPYRLEEVRADFQSTEKGRWVQPCAGLVDGVIVVAGAIEASLVDNPDSALLRVHTHPDHRRRGHGSLMLGYLEHLASERGRIVLDAESAWSIEAGPHQGGREFLTQNGYHLGLVSIQQALDVPVPEDALNRTADEIEPHHAAYALHSWVGSVPKEYAEVLAELTALLPVEAPTGELHREPGSSDVENLRDSERTLAAQGRTKYTTIATDAGGAVAGYTEIVASEHEEAQAFQWDTLVRGGHRGHRLGMAMKVANLRLLQAERPEISRVITFNAESNGPMIAVNERLGFRAVEYLGEFQKHVESVSEPGG